MNISNGKERIMKKTLKHRSAIAKDLRTPKYRPRVVKSKKNYNRKKLKKEE
jgi:hypothetical protein